MLPLITAIFFASLLGSLHCAGMCGAFLAIATGDTGSWKRHALLQSAYHGGRLLSYTLLGAVAGAVGHFINLGGMLAGVSRVATVVAGATLIAFALLTLLQVTGANVGRLHPPAALGRLVASAHRRAMSHPPLARAGLIGLFTTLLPCGWLYAFATAAAGTASPVLGALTMAVFWLGTVPVLVALGAGLRSVLGPVGRRLPVLTCLVLVVVGTWTLLGRSGLDAIALAARAGAQHEHLHASESPASTDPIESMKNIKPACCPADVPTEARP